MTYTVDPMMRSLLQKEARTNGMYGYMVKVETHLVSTGLYQDGYEPLDGPKEKRRTIVDKKGDVKAWHELEDLDFPHNYAEDFELTPSDIWRMQNMNGSEELLPHEISKQVYFKKLDELRGRILAAHTTEQLYALSDECNEIDLFMLNRVENWKTVKTTFERIETQFTRVENRIKASAAERTHLISVGIIKPKEVAIAI